MIDYLDDFVVNRTAEETYEAYVYDYEMHEEWYDVEASFCEQMEIEPEVYED